MYVLRCAAIAPRSRLSFNGFATVLRSALLPLNEPAQANVLQRTLPASAVLTSDLTLSVEQEVSVPATTGTARTVQKSCLSMNNHLGRRSPTASRLPLRSQRRYQCTVDASGLEGFTEYQSPTRQHARLAVAETESRKRHAVDFPVRGDVQHQPDFELQRTGADAGSRTLRRIEVDVGDQVGRDLHGAAVKDHADVVAQLGAVAQPR